MQRLSLLAFVAFLSLPSVCLAGVGRVELYSDAGLSQCSLRDTNPGMADVYVVHVTAGTVMESDASGIQLRLGSSVGFTGTWLADIFPAGTSHSGTSQSGVGIGYGIQCPTGGAILALQVRYQMQGTSSACSFVEAGPAPGLLSIASTTCYFFAEFPVDGDRIFINPDASCECDGPLATQPTTWGRVKAMYRN